MPFIPIVQNNQLFMKKICEFSRLVSWGRKVIETKQINKKQLKRPNFLFEGEQSVSGFSVSCLQVCVKRRSWCSAVWMAVICIYFLAQYVQLFSPLLQLGSHHRARTSRPQQVLKWGMCGWRDRYQLCQPAFLGAVPWSWSSSWAINHTQNETQIWYLRPLNKQFCEFMAFTRPKNITKILSQGPLLGFGSLSGILSLYVPVTMQEHGLPLPSAGVSAWLSTRSVALGLQPSCCQWLGSPGSFVCVTHSKIMCLFVYLPLCPSGAVCLLELETQHVCWLRGWTVVFCVANLFKNI